nr:hypothetical protein [Micromonospora sp. DSM 115978]
MAATPLVLARALGVAGAEGPVYAYGSMQFGSPLAQAVATGCSVAGAVVVVGAVGWWWVLGRVEGSTVADRSFLLMVLLVVTARVLSPQYLLWLLAVAACRPDPWGPSGRTPPWRRPAVLLLVTALLSQVVYPMTYDGLLAGDLLPSVLL